MVWDAAYQPFGELQASTGAGPDERFPGQHFDAETGLHQNHHRTYDPTTGRYIEPDPIGLAGGWNRYAYVNGDPVGLIDPTGEYAGAVGVGFVAGVVGDVALQLALKGCIDPPEVLIAGGLGAVGGSALAWLPRLRHLIPLLSRAPHVAKLRVVGGGRSVGAREVMWKEGNERVGRSARNG